MPKTKTSKYDVAEHLRTPEEMAAYLEACLEEANGDAAFIAKGLGDIARAKGMSQVARDAGSSREAFMVKGA
jgi:probable addiction module antidote protein